MPRVSRVAVDNRNRPTPTARGVCEPMSSGSNPDDRFSEDPRNSPDAFGDLPFGTINQPPLNDDDPLPPKVGVKPEDPGPTVMELLQQILQRLDRIEQPGIG